jgi:hypothetical protein
MSREIPEVVRAAAGLAATVLDEARKLPETLPGLPVRLIGLAMQQAMKVQQQYAGLVARGDELFTGLRGENEPGLATFDDEIDEPAPSGFRESAFDRATAEAPVSDGVADQSAEAVPGTDEILEELAIDELVDQAPTLEETAPTVDVLTPEGGVTTVEAAVTDEGIAAPETDGTAAAGAPAKRAAKKAPAKKAPAKKAASKRAAKAPAEKSAAKKAAPTPTTGTDAGPATATDEGGSPVAVATGVRADEGSSATPEETAAIAEGAAVDAVGDTSTAPTDDPQGGSELSGSQAAGTAPIDGYDSFSIAQLRGRLRGYAHSTVSELLAYEEATKAREPYLRMLRNRLERLDEQAVSASPLAPRGA